jgi:hypothetical protein
MIGELETVVVAGQAAGAESLIYYGSDLFEFIKRAISVDFAVRSGTLIEVKSITCGI